MKFEKVHLEIILVYVPEIYTDWEGVEIKHIHLDRYFWRKAYDFMRYMFRSPEALKRKVQESLEDAIFTHEFEPPKPETKEKTPEKEVILQIQLLFPIIIFYLLLFFPIFYLIFHFKLLQIET